jgi:hypothetical protein
MGQVMHNSVMENRTAHLFKLSKSSATPMPS